jgi:hypothetical protein
MQIAVLLQGLPFADAIVRHAHLAGFSAGIYDSDAQMANALQEGEQVVVRRGASEHSRDAVPQSPQIQTISIEPMDAETGSYFKGADWHMASAEMGEQEAAIPARILRRLGHKLRVAVLLNHALTPTQHKNLGKRYPDCEIEYPPAPLQRLFGQFPPGTQFPEQEAQKITAWLQSTLRPGDIAWIQGENGLSFYLVNFALQMGCIPIYATTKRDAYDTHLSDNSVELKHTFVFSGFREYVRPACAPAVVRLQA